MEIRSEPLPSGLETCAFAMKVYRHEPRSSHALAPARRFPGEIGDTPAVERWISARRSGASSGPASTTQSRICCVEHSGQRRCAVFPDSATRLVFRVHLIYGLVRTQLSAGTVPTLHRFHSNAGGATISS
jgi:hypothetical protein